MEDLDAASVDDVKAFFRTYYAPNNAVLSIVGDVDPAEARAWAERYFGAHPGQPVDPAARRPEPAPDARRRAPRDRRGPRPAAARLLRVPRAGASATTGSTRSRSRPRSWPAARAAGSIVGSSATSGSPRTSSLFTLGLHRRRVDRGRLGDRPAGRPDRARRGGRSTRSSSGSAASSSPTTSWPAPGRSSRPRSSARSSGSRSAPTASRCTRRCSTTRTSSTGCSRATCPSPPSRSATAAADVFRADNRVVLTYLPALPPADEEPGPLDAVDPAGPDGRAVRRRRGRA